jgi:hypothetical protein
MVESPDPVEGVVGWAAGCSLQVVAGPLVVLHIFCISARQRLITAIGLS